MARADYFGNRLLAVRKGAGMTQQELADKAGLTQWSIAQIENGHRVPGFETVLALAEALGVPLSAFDPSTEVPKPKPKKRKPRRKPD